MMKRETDRRIEKTWGSVGRWKVEVRRWQVAGVSPCFHVPWVHDGKVGRYLKVMVSFQFSISISGNETALSESVSVSVSVVVSLLMLLALGAGCWVLGAGCWVLGAGCCGPEH